MNYEVPRFRLDEDNDIIDNAKIKVYSFNSQKDWEKLLILLNTLEGQLQRAVTEKTTIVNQIKETYDEYNNYIDEYSLMKIDIIMDIAQELNIELE